MITPAQLSSSVEVTINPNQPLTLATHHTRSTSSITPPSSSNAVASPTVIQSSSAQNIIPQSASNAVASPTVIRSLSAQNNIPHSANNAAVSPPVFQSPAAQPYMFKDLTAMIKVCAGCRLGYSNRKPPFDICLVDKETRIIKKNH